MSKFGYMAEGELNSNYLQGLINECLDKYFQANSKVDNQQLEQQNNSSNNKKSVLDYINQIKDKLNIFNQTNLLDARTFFEIKQTLSTIKYDIVIPLIEVNREKVIIQAHKRFLNVLNDINGLRGADTDYILFNSPVSDLKPFLSEKVSRHKVNVLEVQKLFKHFVDLRYNELTNVTFEQYTPTFDAKIQDFCNDNITENGIGSGVERFIRMQMLKKFDGGDDKPQIDEVNQINILLKKLKLTKIETMMQKLAQLKTNKAQVKEVIDKCKDTINNSAIINKAGIFLLMDNLFYKLTKKCDVLQQKIKLKLQSVSRQKILEIQNIDSVSYQNPLIQETQTVEDSTKPIASDLYDEDEENEINITEDDGSDDAEDEIVIDDHNE